MPTDETYNGWKNYPTWAVNLWLSNDEGLYREATAMAETWSRGDHPRVVLADRFKTWVTDMGVSVVNRYAGDAATGDPTGFGADLYGWALAQVDWYEIADAWIESASEVEA
jgi:hypothetical protein